jgi:hypothetical protein
MGIHGPTPCLVSSELYSKIRDRGGEIDGKCLPVFDIFPDRSVHYCFPLKGKVFVPLIDDFSSLQEIENSLIRETMVLRAISFPWDDCLWCPEALSNNCHGGCIAQKRIVDRGLDENWTHFDEMVPRLDPKAYADQQFFLWMGKPQTVENSDLSILAECNGKNSLREIFESQSIGLSRFQLVRERDSFSNKIANFVRRGWIFLQPMKVSKELR